MDDRVDLADVGEELIAEAFALGRAADEAGDVDEFDLSLDLLRRLGDRAELVEAWVGHRDAANIRLNGAERIIRRLRRRSLCQRVEKRRFADVWQADDAAAKAHGFSGLTVMLSSIQQPFWGRTVPLTKMGPETSSGRRFFDLRRLFAEDRDGALKVLEDERTLLRRIAGV